VPSHILSVAARRRTLRQLIEEARGHVMDVDAGRYSDEDFLTYINNALYEIYRLRPDAYFGPLGNVVPQYETDDLDEEFPLSGIFYTATVYFLAGSASLRDDEHVVESRATALLAMFAAKLIGSKA
jgi:hypothetical protein